MKALESGPAAFAAPPQQLGASVGAQRLATCPMICWS